MVLPQWILFGIPRTMDEAYEISQVCGGYTTGYTAETFRSRWPCPSLYASWDYAPIWPMSLIWGPVDYYGVVLPCAYYYKRAQEPLHVLMQLDPKEHIKIPVLQIDAFPKVFEPGGSSGERSMSPAIWITRSASMSRRYGSTAGTSACFMKRP